MTKAAERWPLEGDRIPSKKRLPIGACFSWRNKLWMRGNGILYRCRGNDPTIWRAFFKREDRRRGRKVACLECGGRGYYIDAPDPALYGHPYVQTCHICYGSGRVHKRRKS